jgi:serine phosphatase RsbU (regulator of sigma subunit)
VKPEDPDKRSRQVGVRRASTDRLSKSLQWPKHVRQALLQHGQEELQAALKVDVESAFRAPYFPRHLSRRDARQTTRMHYFFCGTEYVRPTIKLATALGTGMRVEAHFQAVRTIGGDFGLAMPCGEDHLNLLIGDVSGHGIGSALVANRIYTEMVTQLRAAMPLGDMLQHMNRFVIENMGISGFFFTAALARIDLGGRRMLFAGGGHPPAMVVTPSQEPRLLESRSMVLGALPEAVSQEATLDVNLRQGDRIVLYSDGITEVFNSRDEMLGVPGLREFVREAALLPFTEMMEGILDRVDAWRKGPPSDDVSLVLVEVN